VANHAVIMPNGMTLAQIQIQTITADGAVWRVDTLHVDIVGLPVTHPVRTKHFVN